MTDTGSGIAPERLRDVFEDFVTTKRHGLGLGLAISKRIVEQLDGTIGVDERGWTRHGVHHPVPGPQRPHHTRGGQLIEQRGDLCFARW